MFLAVIAVLNLFQLVLYPFHLGPVVPVIYAIFAQALRHMYVSLSRARRLRGVYLAVVLPFCVILVGAMKQEAGTRDSHVLLGVCAGASPRRPGTKGTVAAIAARQAPGDCPVCEVHNPNQEWVYNKADIDAQKIVWAREMDAASDGRLLEYFGDRKGWLVQADEYPPRLVRYEGHSEVKKETERESALQFMRGSGGRE